MHLNNYKFGIIKYKPNNYKITMFKKEKEELIKNNNNSKLNNRYHKTN